MTASEFRGLPAGIVTRTLACVLDAVVVTSALLVLWTGWTVVTFLARPVRFTVPSPSWTVVALVGSAAAVLYLATSWAVAGRTYGAQVLGLRVLRHDGRPLRWSRSLLRAVICVLVPLGLVWSVVDRRNRSLQDLLCGSTVVYDWVPRSTSARTHGLLGADAIAEVVAELEAREPVRRPHLTQSPTESPTESPTVAPVE
jgi:uncharacterized RDD family membrane protein YckC